MPDFSSRIESNLRLIIIADIDVEFKRATALHSKFNSRHEGLASSKGAVD